MDQRSLRNARKGQLFYCLIQTYGHAVEFVVFSPEQYGPVSNQISTIHSLFSNDPSPHSLLCLL
jgi:hypothetical protein